MCAQRLFGRDQERKCVMDKERNSEPAHTLQSKFACLLHGGIRPTEKESAFLFAFILKSRDASPTQSNEQAREFERHRRKE